MKEIPLKQGNVALIDDEMFDRVSYFKWFMTCGRNTNYARTSGVLYNDKQNSFSMHQLVLSFYSTGMQIDHINGNGLDNRKENLRICTQSQNLMNSTCIKKGSSKYKGVVYVKKTNKFYAHIKLNTKIIYLGTFNTEIEAAQAYNLAASKFFVSFARLNNIEEDENFNKLLIINENNPCFINNFDIYLLNILNNNGTMAHNSILPTKLDKVERNNKIAVMFDDLPGTITSRVRFLAEQSGISEPMVRVILKKAKRIGK